MALDMSKFSKQADFSQNFIGGLCTSSMLHDEDLLL